MSALTTPTPVPTRAGSEFPPRLPIPSRNWLILFYTLTAIAALSLIIFYALNRATIGHTHNATTINLAGRQRMLSQRTALFTMRLLFDADNRDATRAQLLQIADQMEAENAQLNAFGLSPDLAALYNGTDGVNARVADYLSHARTLAALPNDDLNANHPDYQALMVESTLMLDQLEDIVAHYQQEVHTGVSRILWLENILIVVVLGALIAQSAWVFRPMLRRVEGEAGELSRQIARREKVEEELRQIGALQRAIVNNARYTIIAARPDGIIQTFNPAAEQKLGYRADDVIGKHTPLVFHTPELLRDRTEAFADEFSIKMEPGFESLTLKARLGYEDQQEWVYVRKDGTHYPVLLSLTALRDDHGELLGYVGIGVDITEMKAAEAMRQHLVDDLELANKDLKDFAYIVSHDLKAPLRAIGSIAGWLAADYADKLDDEGRQMLGMMEQRVGRMERLIDGVLHYSRIGRSEHASRPVDTAALVVLAIDNLAPPPQAQVLIETPLPIVMSDPTRVEQVFQNLIGNALKFNKQPTPIVRVGACEDENMWEFYVSDNGPGIETKHFQRVFQLFQTLHPRDEVEGTGIGLTIVKRVVETYGGRVWIESVVGEGTTFRFTLPKVVMVEPTAILNAAAEMKASS